MKEFRPGFRLSLTDLCILVLGLMLSSAVGVSMPWPGIAIAFVIVNYLLFCNVFRMARPLELVWAVVFVALAAFTIILGWPNWPATLALSSVVTAVLVAIEMRKPSYHGIFWQKINSGLPDWWRVNSSIE